ncbi:MAG: SNF2-related protein [Acetobacteraceae bacterium]
MNMLVPPPPAQPPGPGPTDEDIAACTGAEALAAARVGRDRPRRIETMFDPAGGRLEVTLSGPGARRLHQAITLRRAPNGRVSIRGMCTCAARGGCIHVAMALLAARENGAFTRGPIPTVEAAAAAAFAPAPAREEELPWAVQSWLDALPRALEVVSEDYPADVRHRVFYVLRPHPSPRGTHGLDIAAQTAILRKDGTPGANASAINFFRFEQGPPPRYVRPSDRIPLARLAARARHAAHAEDDHADTLRRILATGRARLESVNGPVLREGPARPGRIEWRLQADGTQRASLLLEAADPEVVSLTLPEPWYLDSATGTLGPVETALPPPVAAELLAAPPLPPAVNAARLRAELARRLPGFTLPTPADPPPMESVTGPPRPVLRLNRRPALMLKDALPNAPEACAEARLAMRYGPVVVPCDASRLQTRVLTHEGRLYRIRRDEAAERAAAETLHGIGLAPRLVIPDYISGVHEADLYLPELRAGAWVPVLLRGLPRLREEGWEIEIAEDFPLRLVEPDAPPEPSFEESGRSAGIDWLELHLGVSIGGEKVDLVPVLVSMIEQLGEGLSLAILMAPEETDFLLELADGRQLTVRLGQIRPIVLALTELIEGGTIDPKSHRVRFNRHHAAELAALETSLPGLRWQGGEALRTMGRVLHEAGGSIPHAVLPAGFNGTLRPYQQRGVDWLQFLRAAELGGVLADDMGLGKTVQTLAHLLIEKESGRLDRPALIVCPTSLVPNWCAEAERFAPGLRLLALHGPQRRGDFERIGGHDIVLSTYPLLTRDAAVLTAQPWHVLVLDEAQTIKNPVAEATQVAASLEARQRLCLSGTPLQNNLGELWSLFHFLAPGFLGTPRQFAARFRNPVEKHGNTAAQTRLARRVRPFLLRRTKEEVAAELPAKTEIVETVVMEPAQRALYDSVRLAMHKRVRAAIRSQGLSRSGIVILDALLKLRQVCCDPRLLRKGTPEENPSAKLARLMELLAELVAEGRRVLLFSQFTAMLDLIVPEVKAAGIPFVALRGSTKDRATPVAQFQAGAVPLFMLSLKAGGTGLNLTAADTVIHYDPWWNPAVEDQATDRAHRIGQERKVFVHRLVTQDSIEEKMELLKTRKRALVDGILNAEAGGALRLTEDDIEALFAV